MALTSSISEVMGYLVLAGIIAGIIYYVFSCEGEDKKKDKKEDNKEAVSNPPIQKPFVAYKDWTVLNTISTLC